MTTQTIESHRRATGPFSLPRLVVIAAAATVVNVLAYLAGSGFGASMVITMPAHQDITVVMAGGATLLPIALAGVVVWFIARKWSAFRGVARWLGFAVAVLSIASPLFISADLATGLTLAVMHIVVALAWVASLREARA